MFFDTAERDARAFDYSRATPIQLAKNDKLKDIGAAGWVANRRSSGPGGGVSSCLSAHAARFGPIEERQIDHAP